MIVMDNNYFQPTFQVLMTFLAAWTGAYFAFSKYRKEQKWNEKRSHYIKVTDALEELLYWAEKTRAESCFEYSNSIEPKFDNALRVLSKYAEIGDLTFSPKIHKAIQNIKIRISQIQFTIHEERNFDSNDPNTQSDWDRHLAVEIRDTINEQMALIKREASKELK